MLQRSSVSRNCLPRSSSALRISRPRFSSASDWLVVAASTPAEATMLHVETDRITPMAVPLMVIVGREALPPGAEADEALLGQAEALAAEAMTL